MIELYDHDNDRLETHNLGVGRTRFEPAGWRPGCARR